MWRVAGELLDWERSVADRRHTEDAVAAKDNLTEQAKQLYGRVAELMSVVLQGRNAVEDLRVKGRDVKIRADNVAHERDSQ